MNLNVTQLVKIFQIETSEVESDWRRCDAKISAIITPKNEILLTTTCEKYMNDTFAQRFLKG